jgi:hypothetical protein
LDPDRTVGFLTDSVVGELELQFGVGNVNVQWVNYDPSDYGVFYSPEVGLALANARLGVSLPTGPDALPENLRTTHDAGVAETKAVLASTREKAAVCPDQKIVLAGYSEGAWVLGDALEEFAEIPENGPFLENRVNAALLFGDPRFDHNADAANRPAALDQDGPLGADGIATVALGARDEYLPTQLAGKAQSYCYGSPALDPICATPTTPESQEVTGDQWADALENCRSAFRAIGEGIGQTLDPDLRSSCGHLAYVGGWAVEFLREIDL